ncbi:TPA: hypothetical protein I7117_15440 [Vibrio vulnificus]|uniref:hypothetical protein n=1 Tax=Vibrio navarrensis TaxID=29495 RepID=UPI0018DD7E29|nr:hypothetical protein [Vibrio navarrensis]EHA1126494.1 hypothetical protein [Vibrio navarrensis]MBH9740060.1 hypothetical protein [Vibrio navarrensis]HAS6100854.1 hypothetical protein [Vibrio vulnificus]HDY8121403.1 hypothetical protein [Vibrio vulnificus]
MSEDRLHFIHSCFGSINQTNVVLANSHREINPAIAFLDHDFNSMCRQLHVQPEQLNNILELSHEIPSYAPTIDSDLTIDGSSTANQLPDSDNVPNQQLLTGFELDFSDLGIDR